MVTAGEAAPDPAPVAAAPQFLDSLEGTAEVAYVCPFKSGVTELFRGAHELMKSSFRLK